MTKSHTLVRRMKSAASNLAVVRDFEKELILGFRGEMRKVNSTLPPHEQNTGTVCRVAAAALFRELKPHSEHGQEILYHYLAARRPGVIYPEMELH